MPGGFFALFHLQEPILDLILADLGRYENQEVLPCILLYFPLK